MAVEVLPARFTLPPRADRSQATIEARLRDAIRSLHANKWTTTVNMAKFEEFYPQLQVARDGDLVVVRVRASKAQPLSAENFSPVLVIAPDKVLNVYESVFNLAHHRCLSGVVLKDALSHIDTITTRAGSYDVAVVPQGNDILVI